MPTAGSRGGREKDKRERKKDREGRRGEGDRASKHSLRALEAKVSKSEQWQKPLFCIFFWGHQVQSTTLLTSIKLFFYFK